MRARKKANKEGVEAIPENAKRPIGRPAFQP